MKEKLKCPECKSEKITKYRCADCKQSIVVIDGEVLAIEFEVKPTRRTVVGGAGTVTYPVDK